MCGRYVFVSPLEAMQAMFRFEGRPNLAPNYNVAPTHEMPIITSDGLVLARWGLIPRWAKDQKSGYRTFNARSEEAATKPTFKEAFTKRHCLVPADGFIEWKRVGPKEKQPYLIRKKGAGCLPSPVSGRPGRMSPATPS